MPGPFGPRSDFSPFPRRPQMEAIRTIEERSNAVADKASLLVQAVIIPGGSTSEGQLVEAVAVPWFDIIELLDADPALAFQIDPRKWEEIIAGAYRKAGFDDVTLTPRSGDLGRDVIAVKRALGTVRVIDQVKATGPVTWSALTTCALFWAYCRETRRPRDSSPPPRILLRNSRMTFF